MAKHNGKTAHGVPGKHRPPRRLIAHGQRRYRKILAEGRGIRDAARQGELRYLQQLASFVKEYSGGDGEQVKEFAKCIQRDTKGRIPANEVLLSHNVFNKWGAVSLQRALGAVLSFEDLGRLAKLNSDPDYRDDLLNKLTSGQISSRRLRELTRGKPERH